MIVVALRLVDLRSDMQEPRVYIKEIANSVTLLQLVTRVQLLLKHHKVHFLRAHATLYKSSTSSISHLFHLFNPLTHYNDITSHPSHYMCIPPHLSYQMDETKEMKRRNANSFSNGKQYLTLHCTVIDVRIRVKRGLSSSLGGSERL